MSNNVLCVIPARAGSKRLRDKNILPLAGLPLIAHSIYCARLTPSIDRVVVSTDCEYIAEVARKHGAEVPFLRPAKLAADSTPGWPVKQHAIEASEEAYGEEYDYMVYLQPTNPTRLPSDIEEALEKLDADAEADAISGVGSPDFDIDRQSLSVDESGRIQHIFDRGEDIKRSQDAEEYVYTNGLLYIYRRDFVLESDAEYDGEHLGYHVPRERCIDIDTRSEFREANWKIETGYLELPWINRPANEQPDCHEPRETWREVMRVGDRLVGDALPSLVVATIETEGDASASRIREAIDRAAETGSDAVKIDVVGQDSTPTFNEITPEAVSDVIHNDLNLSLEQLREIKEYARDKDLVFLTDSLNRFAVRSDVAFEPNIVRVNLEELREPEVLDFFRGRQIPLVVDTNGVGMEEISDVVGELKGEGYPPFALVYGGRQSKREMAPFNLKALETLQIEYGVPVGWRDKSGETRFAIASAVKGADMVEKRLIDHPDEGTCDAEDGLHPDRFGDMIAGIRSVESALGHGCLDPEVE